MKKLFTTIILLLTIGYIGTNYKKIINYVMYNVVYKDDFIINEANAYHKENHWQYVEETDNLYPSNKQDILNIFYTALNRGYDEVTFFCTENYENCLDEVEEIAKNPTVLSNINNFVSPYNGYKRIIVNLNNFGRVNIKINKIYTEDQINKINTKINQIYNEITTEDMTDTDKIKAIHDYIINNTSYDSEKSKEIMSGIYGNYSDASTAYGTLFNGKAICGGYTDTMALFLDKMNIPNYKVASDKHIWNFLYIDGSWKHLDLTWDDPVVNTGEDVLMHTFFLISTEDLEDKKTEQHSYNKNIYIEAT